MPNGGRKSKTPAAVTVAQSDTVSHFVTRAETSLPASADTVVYELDVAPEIAVDPRYHLYEIGPNDPHTGCHDPPVVDNTVPTRPETAGDNTGTTVFTGACGTHGGGGPAKTPATPATPRTPATTTATPNAAIQRAPRCSHTLLHARPARCVIECSPV